MFDTLNVLSDTGLGVRDRNSDDMVTELGKIIVNRLVYANL